MRLWSTCLPRDSPADRLPSYVMRLLIARCTVDYVGRLTAHLADAVRLLMVKAAGPVLVHSDTGGDKPLMWMTPPSAEALGSAPQCGDVGGIGAAAAAQGGDRRDLCEQFHGRATEQLAVTSVQYVHHVELGMGER